MSWLFVFNLLEGHYLIQFFFLMISGVVFFEMEANALGRESEKEGDESEHDGKDEKDTDEEIFPSQSVLSGSESNEGNDSDERDEPDETDDHPIPNGSVGEEERKKLKSIRIKREFNGQDGFVSNFDAAFDDVEVKLEVEEEENVDGVVSGRKSRRAAASAASNSIKNSSEIQERSEEFFEDEDEGTLKKKRRKSVRENVDIKSGSVHCLVCDKGFRTLPYLRKHVKMGKCGRTYPEEELAKLKDQVSKKTNSSSALPEGEGFECEACHRVLATKAGRARHITRSPR